MRSNSGRLLPLSATSQLVNKVIKAALSAQQLSIHTQLEIHTHTQCHVPHLQYHPLRATLYYISFFPLTPTARQQLSLDLHRLGSRIPPHPRLCQQQLHRPRMPILPSIPSPPPFQYTPNCTHACPDSPTEALTPADRNPPRATHLYSHLPTPGCASNSSTVPACPCSIA